MAKIIHQRKKCVGCSNCVLVCPKFFEIVKKDGLANLKNSLKNKNNFELIIKNNKNINCIKRAANACPTKIIEILREKSQ